MEDELTPKSVAEKIFYSPATNGKTAKSLKDGEQMIVDLIDAALRKHKEETMGFNVYDFFYYGSEPEQINSMHILYTLTPKKGYDAVFDKVSSSFLPTTEAMAKKQLQCRRVELLIFERDNPDVKKARTNKRNGE